mmetsp:Transcript_66605/g.149549  ORF Transcript_66605/g.149549 Transcript_66605/m.149549 type:complete len:234 (-) Transcript_66605:183-884(-)
MGSCWIASRGSSAPQEPTTSTGRCRQSLLPRTWRKTQTPWASPPSQVRPRQPRGRRVLHTPMRLLSVTARRAENRAALLAPLLAPAGEAAPGERRRGARAALRAVPPRAARATRRAPKEAAPKASARSVDADITAGTAARPKATADSAGAATRGDAGGVAAGGAAGPRRRASPRPVAAETAVAASAAAATATTSMSSFRRISSRPAWLEPSGRCQRPLRRRSWVPTEGRTATC